jgi:Arc/MetJ family transcription regulator
MAKRRVTTRVDRAKLKAAKKILGTRTTTETVDAALDAVVHREAGRKLMEILDTPGALELDNPDVMMGAWRSEGRSSS